MIWSALPAAAAALIAALPLPVQQQQAQPALTAEQEARRAKAQALLAEAKAAEQAGDKARMFAKTEEAVKVLDHPDAMHTLGHMYERTADVPGAKDKAFEWFLEAAERGHGEAMTHAVEPLKADATLSDAQYSKITSALAEGMEQNPFSPVRSTLNALAKKQEAAAQCAVDLAKRLGYVADDTSDMFGGGRSTNWYMVRNGAGTASSGDQLSIHGAEAGSLFAGSAYSRLSVRATGFTGIEFKDIPISQGRVFTMKSYTGFRENASAQGQRDAQTILNACRAQ